MVGTERILSLLRRHRNDLDAAAKALISAANRKGGDDNITVVAFEIARAGDETLRLPAAAPPGEEDELAPDEEDTLDETEGVPAVSTQVIRVEDLAALRESGTAAAPAAAAPERQPEDIEEVFEEERRAPGRRRIAVVVGVVAILAAVAALLYLLDVI